MGFLEGELRLGSDPAADCWRELVPSFDEDLLGFLPVLLLILMIPVV